MSAPDAKKPRLDDEDPSILEVQKFQDQLEDLNEKASEEILKVEQKYNKQRKPLFLKRQEAIKKLDASNNVHFWAAAMLNHPVLASMISEYEQKILESLTSIDVQEDDDIKSGFTITFTFQKNDYFENETIAKKYHMSAEGEVKNSNTEIKWKKDKNPKNIENVEAEFVEWLEFENEDTSDDIADLIKDDLWLNPYQYFLGLMDSDSEDEAEGDENAMQK